MKKVLDFDEQILSRLEAEQKRRKEISLYKNYPLNRVIFELLDSALKNIERGT